MSPRCPLPMGVSKALPNNKDWSVITLCEQGWLTPDHVERCPITWQTLLRHAPLPRVAAVSRDMLREGNWLVPRLNGQPFLEEPPLFYWLQAASYRIGGVPSAVTARSSCSRRAGRSRRTSSLIAAPARRRTLCRSPFARRSFAWSARSR